MQSLGRIQSVRLFPVREWGRWVLLGMLALPLSLSAQSGSSAVAEVKKTTGKVDAQRGNTQLWRPTKPGVKLALRDRIRTRSKSSAAVQLANLSMLNLGENTITAIEPPEGSEPARAKLKLLQGIFQFQHRNGRRELELDTATASAVIKGTEFMLEVLPDKTTVLTLIDGEVDLTSTNGGMVKMVASKENGISIAGTVRPGNAPPTTAKVDTLNVMQWTLYYPGVLDPRAFSGLQHGALSDSLAAYRRGNLRAAWDAVPEPHAPANEHERIYLLALDYAGGRQVDPKSLERDFGTAEPLAEALRLLHAAVRHETVTAPPNMTPSQWLAWSYHEQAHHRLAEALAAAKEAAARSPEFGFAWARVAELEFSHGRIKRMEEAVERARELAPENAQLRALGGFVELARNEEEAAQAEFDAALQLDPDLGNAWLGRGLSRVQEGDALGGLSDFETAAAVEPQQWLFRSYLGKAFNHAAQFVKDPKLKKLYLDRAAEELAVARRKDPDDPTPYLYSALLNHQRVRTAEAISDLEQSIANNTNRAVYRSGLLLDQDQAVRSANLANIYESAGFREVSLRESARAVMFDYANYSAHLNLASSYDLLRDPTRFNLRNETEWSIAYLNATLLAPVGGGTLSQNYSQNEYSRPFTTRRFGLTSLTEYFGDSKEVRQRATHFGRIDKFAYAFDLDYNYKDGNRHNNDLSRIEWSSLAKYQLGPRDSLLVWTTYQDFDSGDNFQYYNPASADPDLRFTEKQEPFVQLGYHHEWSPGNHTLFLGGRLVSEQRFSDRARQEITEDVSAFFPVPTAMTTHNASSRTEVELYTVELSQISKRAAHTDIVGLRYHGGQFDAAATHVIIPAGTVFPTTGNGDFERLTAYWYHSWELTDELQLTGGAALDRLTSPRNFRRLPLTDGEVTRDRFLPKASLVYHPNSRFTARALYAQALGGVTFDESLRLEPAQLAGFSQSFRTLISESLVGSVEGADYEIYGAGLDYKFASRTYLILEAQQRRQELDRSSGIFQFNNMGFAGGGAIRAATASEQLRYRERLVTLTLNQVLAPHWFLQGQYRITDAELSRAFPQLASGAIRVRNEADLQELRFAANFQMPRGPFATFEANYYLQANRGNGAPGPGDSFPQLNLIGGFTFNNRRGDIAVGILNLTNHDYRLNPVTYYQELPRSRSLYARLRFSF